jgi:hypothetical protein
MQNGLRVVAQAVEYLTSKRPEFSPSYHQKKEKGDREKINHGKKLASLMCFSMEGGGMVK